MERGNQRGRDGGNNAETAEGKNSRLKKQ